MKSTETVMEEIWATIEPEKWNDWHWQLQNKITSFEQLERLVKLSADEAAGIKDALSKFRMAITPYWPVSYTHLRAHET